MPDAGVAGPLRRLVVLLSGAAVLAGCAGSPDGRVGAPTPTRPHGPTVVGSAVLPSLMARATPTDAAVPTVETAVGGLAGRLGQALARNGDQTPGVRVSQKSAAGDQLIVRWTLGSRWPDPGARTRVRVDAVTILAAIRRSDVRYGSVLLLATGVSLVKDRRKVSIVVRAKYTQRLVRGTDWSRVSPGKVLGMCDDKPAVIAVGYR